MRIRLQLLIAITASVALGVVAALLTGHAAREENAANETQSRAQTTSHEVSGLLVLTQEYARYTEARAAQQWHHRHATISKALAQDQDAGGSAALRELRAVTAALPELFSRLEELPADDAPLTQQRKEVLNDQLLTSTQAMSDLAYQWYQDAEAVHAKAEERFQWLAIVTPFLLLTMLVALAIIIRQRVLAPLAALEAATASVSRGDLTVRIGNTSRDELGALSRQFDRMTQALDSSSQQLQRSETQLKAITDNLPILISYIDTDRRLRFVNAHHETTLGRSVQSLIDSPVAHGLGALWHRQVETQLDAALAGERQHFECTVQLGGEARHLVIDYVPDTDDTGTVRGVYSMTFDNTHRKHAETALRDSERRLRDISDNIPAMVGYFDAQERCIFANSTVLKAHGIDEGDISRHTLRSGLGEDSYRLHEPHVRRVLAGEMAAFEGHLHRRGRDVYFQAHLVPDKDADNKVRGFYIMTFDVSAVRQAEIDRGLSEKLLRQITDNLPVLIAYLDREERVQFANGTYRTWLGVDPKSLNGLPIREAVGEHLYEARRSYLQRALAGERVEFESDATTLGVTRTVNTVYIPDVDADGTVRGVYTLSSDVSALKAVERQLQALARSDTLTQLPNRLHFNERLPEALARAQRSGSGLGLMFLDIDHFKSINDTLGHAAGDAVLQQFAHRLIGCVRLTDTVARLAGDEFVIILEGLHEPVALQLIATKIVAHVNEPMVIDGGDLRISTSVGVAFHDPSRPGVTSDTLLAMADEALYAAKAAGRNTFRIAAQPPARARA